MFYIGGSVRLIYQFFKVTNAWETEQAAKAARKVTNILEKAARDEFYTLEAVRLKTELDRLLQLCELYKEAEALKLPKVLDIIPLEPIEGYLRFYEVLLRGVTTAENFVCFFIFRFCFGLYFLDFNNFFKKPKAKL